MTPARTLSKDALRAQVEKLDRANTALRTKNREANRAAKLSAARMAELEGEATGDAVPPGVAPADPEPADREAEIGRENLEAHLRGE